MKTENLTSKELALYSQLAEETDLSEEDQAVLEFLSDRLNEETES